MKKTTIIDVARAAGVSTATVSRVINGDPAVGQAYREQVEAAISRLQYRPQLSARAVRGGQTRLIGMLLPRFDLQVFSRLADGAMQEAAKLGYHIVMKSCEGSSARERERLLDFSALPVDGMIVRPVSFRSSCDPLHHHIDKPVVGINWLGNTRYVFPSCAQESAYLAARYLLRIGRRRIALMISFREQNVTSVDALEDLAATGSPEVSVGRYLGYKRALEEAGVAFDASLILFHGYTQEGGYSAAQHLLGQDVWADAMICANDEAALGALSFLREQGVQVPRQISLTGFDNSDICHATTPAMTSIDFDSLNTGRTAVQILDALLHGREPDPQMLERKISLVIRGSTCAPDDA